MKFWLHIVCKLNSPLHSTLLENQSHNKWLICKKFKNLMRENVAYNYIWKVLSSLFLIYS